VAPGRVGVPPAPAGILPASGRLEVDEFMRVPGAEHVWAAGDCADAPHPEGGTCPPLALYAQRGGALAGANILRLLAGRRLKAFSFSGLGEACTLGHGSAVAYLKGIRVTGWLAWIGRRAILWSMFVPAWDRKVRLLAAGCSPRAWVATW
jgi:NADH dehydrogenase